MDLAINLTHLQPMDIERINRCHIYLRAETMADITNARGTHILANAYFCDPAGRVTRQDKWPYQPRTGIQHRTA